MKTFNKSLLVASVAALAPLACLPAASATTFPGGQIHFHGLVIDSGCTVGGLTPSGSTTVSDIDMGVYTPGDFTAQGALVGAGTTGGPVDASLELADCPAGVNGVSVTLTSPEGDDADIPGNFAIATGAGAATGFALQMQYGAAIAGGPAAGDQIAYGVESAQFPIDSATGTGTLALQGQYITTADVAGGTPVTAGTADNNVQIAMTYY